ncbi:MerR family transcriptional regulator [Alkalihalophilus marmarensis]|uniref:MerR family transcriptional regulator n=1 Tax=Alkalihalophilus marmarensis TaxID=521377 RepID=UPI002DBC98E9|nr:MerR family transcriptional regulator [Alkalihalophilus marmarensis]MEC2074056.1 MerR family transcriptional regulator [Alkalihalophilus marmarensis]
MYRTKEMAQLVGVHPNTVRIYEDWGYISPVPRKENGYRFYSEVHLLQMKIARLLFTCEIVQGDMRNRARQIVYASGKEDFQGSLQLTTQYISHLETEYHHAVKAADVVEKWLRKESVQGNQTYSRKEVAKLLSVTSEALRNWERNGLISVPRLENGFRVYGEKEVEQLRVIRSLRQAHYSLNAILRLFSTIKHRGSAVIEILDTPSESEDIVSVTDQLITSLTLAITYADDAKKLVVGYLKMDKTSAKRLK